MSSDADIIKEFHSKVGFIPWKELEEFILKTPHVWRPIKGHCFETLFDNFIESLGKHTKPIGGDDAVDREINGITLQLKTPYISGTISGQRISYALHKTHGLEKKPHNLYTHSDFADFLIGFHPEDKLIICPNQQIPRNKDYPNRKWGEYLADPVIFDWNSKWINRFDLLGLDIKEFKNPHNGENNELFPRIGKETRLSDIEIIKTIMKPENFRVFVHNLQGSIREIHFNKACEERGIKLSEVSSDRTTREKIKVDFLYKGKKIQVKGITKRLSQQETLGVEIKGSHGRTPQRLYKKNDFDVLAVVIDPYLLPPSKDIDNTKYNFYLINVSALPLHKNSKKNMYAFKKVYKNGDWKIAYSTNPQKGYYDEEKTQEWNYEYLKDILKFNTKTVKLNNFELLEE